MMLWRKTHILIFGLLAVGALAACSSLGGAAAGEEVTKTVIPQFPTQTDGADLDLVENRSCLIKEAVPVQINDPQGDLIAWSPVNDELALVEPDNHYWQWYVGELAIYSPNRDSISIITQDQAVFGDVTWSPDGANLAYVVLDREAKYYTVLVTDKTGTSHLDLFGTANDPKTDPWSSKKGITGWSDQDGLILSSSCGSDCARTYYYSPEASLLTEGGEIRRTEDTSLIPVSTAESPDGTWIIRTDSDDNVWLTAVASKRISLLLLNTQLQEIKWSTSSNFFALRTADRILVYRPVCPQK